MQEQEQQESARSPVPEIIGAASVGAAAAAALAIFAYRHTHHEPIPEQRDEVDYRVAAGILNEERLNREHPQRQRHVNQIAALIATYHHLQQDDLIALTGDSRWTVSRSVSHLVDRGLVERVQARKKPRPTPGYYAATPALEYALGQPDSYPQLAEAMRQLEVDASDNS